MTKAEEVLDALIEKELKPGDPLIFTNDYGSHDCVFVSWHPPTKTRLTDYMRIRFEASHRKSFTAIVHKDKVRSDRS